MASPAYQGTPDNRPLPLGAALSKLPAQYGKVLTHPSVQTFVEEKEQASWGSIWCQLLFLGLVSALLDVLALAIAPPHLGNIQGIDPATEHAIILITSAILVLVATQLSFLAGSGVFYLFARLLKGNGSYLQQTYTLVLLGVPMVLLSDLLMLIPATNTWLPYIPHIYSLVLFVFALIAVHRRAGQ